MTITHIIFSSYTYGVLSNVKVGYPVHDLKGTIWGFCTIVFPSQIYNIGPLSLIQAEFPCWVKEQDEAVVECVHAQEKCPKAISRYFQDKCSKTVPSSCIHLLCWSFNRSVKWTWTGSAFSTNESAWSAMVTGALRAASHTSQELWPWNCENPKESVPRPSNHTPKTI